MVSPSAPAPRSRRPSRSLRKEVLLNEEECAALQSKADAVGMPLSTFLRVSGLKTHIRHRRDEQKHLAILNRINANLNMIAKWANTFKGHAEGAIVTAHLRAVEREITRLIATLEHR